MHDVFSNKGNEKSYDDAISCCFGYVFKIKTTRHTSELQ